MEPFVGEVRLMGFAYDTQDGWLLCDGRILQVTRYQALFSLLGNKFGGDGRTTFGIPDLRGRVAVNNNSTYALGATGGAENVALTSTTIPAHTHAINATSETADKAGVGTASTRLLGTTTASLYGSATNMVAMNDALSTAGGAASHSNMQPSQVVAYYIATMGLYPQRP